MKRSLLVLAMLSSAASTALADLPKSCPDPNEILISGACTRREVAQKDSVVAQYHEGLEALVANPRRAFELFDAACNKRGHGPSCTQLGRMYESSRGRVVPKNADKARGLYEQACKRGDGPGCRLLGTADVNQSKGLTDQAKLKSARRYLELACEKDEPFACGMLGKLLEYDYGGPPDPKRAVLVHGKASRAFAKRCPIDDKKAKRDGEVCWQYGHVLAEGWGMPKDPARSQRAYELACDANHGIGCAKLIETLRERGKSVLELSELYRKACRLEVGFTCSTLGEAIANRDRGKSTETAELARRACELDPKDCGLLGELHRLGWAGMPKDEAEANKIYRGACDAGEQFWCTKYATRLREGIGVKADLAAAVTMLERGCDAKDAAACNQLARSLTTTKTDADDARAYVAARAGCRLGDADACLVAAWQVEQNRRGGAPVAERADRVKEAIGYYESACNLDSATACNSAAGLYLEGVGVAKDVEKGMARYHKACDAAEPSGDACLSIAIILFEGTLVAKDTKGAFRGAARACGRDVASACDWVAGAVVEADDIKTVTTELSTACPNVERACVALANVLLRSTTADKARANTVLAESCGRKHYPACIRAAWALWNGEAGNADKLAAEKMLAMHCDDRDGPSCHEAAAMASDRRDGTAVLKYAGRGCELKHAESCGTLGYTYYVGTPPVESSIELAHKYDAMACELGSAMGCANTAEHYRYGIGVTRDAKKALALYIESCTKGAAYGCAGHAHFLLVGEGGAKRDVSVAIEMLRKACDDRRTPISEACVDLADALESTKKGTTSEIAALREKALRLTKKYAATNPMYEYWLGTFYRDGTLVAKDLAEARSWFVKACEKADPLGCNAAGAMFAASSDPGDREKAGAYFRKACAVKLEEACQGLEALKAAPAPKPPTPAVVKSKSRGCATGPDAGALVGLALVGLLRRRNRRAAR